MSQSQQHLHLIVCCVCCRHLSHCEKARLRLGSGVCLSEDQDQIDCTPLFTRTGRMLSFDVVCPCAAFICVYLFCVGVFTFMYTICACLYALASMCGNVWELPYATLAFVDCWRAFFQGKLSTLQDGVEGSLCVSSGISAFIFLTCFLMSGLSMECWGSDLDDVTINTVRW